MRPWEQQQHLQRQRQRMSSSEPPSDYGLPPHLLRIAAPAPMLPKRKRESATGAPTPARSSTDGVPAKQKVKAKKGEKKSEKSVM